ncbi:MAG TPA: hypothetical protein VKR31_00080 [Rhizomicrobium sp.]|nr:hypothetical protein [Rhizomicrobium sp.]
MKKRTQQAGPRPPSEKQWQAFERAYAIAETGDMAKARVAYERAARMGSPHAQINLAHLYDGGAFGFVDRARARALGKRAFRQGYAQGAYNLAQTYRMDNKRRWYFYWLRRAANAGDTDAKEELRSLETAASKIK